MPDIKHCASCGAKLTNKRKHALTCSNTCRWRVWYAKQQLMVPVKLAFSVKHFESISEAADKQGVTIANYIISRSIGSEIATTISA